jgi:hypothetical protein
LSPIPLAATFRNQSCITSNYASKSILRAALDEFLRESEKHNTSIFYFPAYEIVNELFFNKYENDKRHLKSDIINAIMNIFIYYYCENNLSEQFIENELKVAMEKSKNFRETI